MEYDSTKFWEWNLYHSKIIWDENDWQNFGNI